MWSHICASTKSLTKPRAVAADVISHKPSAIPMVVKQWWSSFDQTPAVAVGKLTNMMIEVCFPDCRRCLGPPPCCELHGESVARRTCISHALAVAGVRTDGEAATIGLQVCKVEWFMLKELCRRKAH